MKYEVTVDGRTFEIEIGPEGRVWVDRCPYDVDLQGVDGLPQYSLLVDNRSHEAHVEKVDEDECQMTVGGRSYRALLKRQRCHSNGSKAQAGQAESMERQGARRTDRGGSPQAELCAPLPGLLLKVCVADGDQVNEGEVVAVLESMKMNLEIRAPQSGVVHTHCADQREVAEGEVLATIDPGPSCSHQA